MRTLLYSFCVVLIFPFWVMAAPPPQSFANLASDLLPAVVNISTTSTAEVSADVELPAMPDFPEGSPFRDFFEEFHNRQGPTIGGKEVPITSLGSGFIIDAAKGYIVTNNHVIRNAQEIRVTFHDDETLKATIVGRDEKMDLAVLQVKTDKKLTALRFGNSDAMRVGDWILAIGNPFGLGGTVTAGIISARARDIQAGPYDDFIQTDASINTGNSGGPMFNLAGEVIGINTAIYSPSGGSVGIGFAVPSVLAEPVIKQLISYGRTRRGWIGVQIQTVTEDIAAGFGLKKPTGALVAALTPQGPAAIAGLKHGDIILTFDGQAVDAMRSLPRIVADTAIGSSIVITYWREGKEYKTTVKVGELEKAEEKGLLAETSDETQDLAIDDSVRIDALGITLSPLTKAVRERYGIDSSVEGVAITTLDPKIAGLIAAVLAEGDVIMEVAQKPATNPKAVADILTKAAKGSQVVLLLNRRGSVRFVAIKITS